MFVLQRNNEYFFFGTRMSQILAMGEWVYIYLLNVAVLPHAAMAPKWNCRLEPRPLPPGSVTPSLKGVLDFLVNTKVSF